jgi:branched-chain amino acid transport system substrate-binding protein
MIFAASLRLTCAAVVIALVCSPSGITRAAGEPYEINAILPLTGQGAFLGKTAQATLSIIEDKVNNAGGIRGRSIKFVVQDDTSNPQVDVQLASALIAEKVPVVLGSVIAASCNAIAPLFRDGPVLLCLSASFHPEPKSYAFSPAITVDDAIAVTVRYLRERGLKRIAYLETLDASGQDGENAFDKALAMPENQDMSVLAREHFAVGDQTVAAQLAKIKASGPQALFTWATGPPMGTIYRGIQDSGLDIPVTVGGQNIGNAMMKQYGAILPKGFVTFATAFMVPDSLPRGALRSNIEDFAATVKAVNGESPDIGYSIAWDPALIVIQALKKFGASTTPQELRDNILGLRGWAGISGTYDFSDGKNRGMKKSENALVMVRWDSASSKWIPTSKFGGEL